MEQKETHIVQISDVFRVEAESEEEAEKIARENVNRKDGWEIYDTEVIDKE
jgi:hypothetical protein